MKTKTDNNRDEHDVICAIMAYGYENGIREFNDDSFEIMEVFYELFKDKKHKKYFENCLWKGTQGSRRCDEIFFVFNTMRSCDLISDLFIKGKMTRGILLKKVYKNFKLHKESKFEEPELKDIQEMSKIFFDKLAYIEKECVIG